MVRSSFPFQGHSHPDGPFSSEDRNSFPSESRNAGNSQRFRRPAPLIEKKPPKDVEVTRSFRVPQKFDDARFVETGDGQRCYMRRVLEVRRELIKVTLPGSMCWGGSYDGKPFLPGSVQHAVALALSSQSWSEKRLQEVAGCFLLQTAKGQHKTQGYIGTEPYYLSGTVKYKDIDRFDKIIYIQDPGAHMTQEQHNRYKEAALQMSRGPILLKSPATSTSGHGGHDSVSASENGVESMVVSIESQSQSSMQMPNSNSPAYNYQADHLTEQENSEEYGSHTPPTTSSLTSFQESVTIPTTRTPGSSSTLSRPLQFHLGSSEQPTSTNNSQMHQRLDDGATNETRNDLTHDFEDFESLLARDDEFTLFSKWNEAKKELRMMKENIHASVINTAVDLTRTDKAITFWRSFDDVMAEEGQKIDGIAKHSIQFLCKQKNLHLGLTNAMLDEFVVPLLDTLDDFNVYSKFDFEKYFAEAAMPMWKEWDLLQTMLPDLVPDFVVSNFENALEKLRSNAALTAKFEEDTITKMRDLYIEWLSEGGANVESIVRNKHNQEDSYLQAKRTYDNTKHLLAVHQISVNALTEFRKWLCKLPIKSIQFYDGAELSAIREICQDAMRQSQPFRDFKAKLVFVAGENEIEESLTVDMGGPTARLLTGAWKSLFGGGFELSTVFERGATGIFHLTSLKPIRTLPLQKAFWLVGQLMFLIILKKVQVYMPMTMATVAHALAQCPTRDEILIDVVDCILEKKRKPTMYLQDFALFQPDWESLMKSLISCTSDKRQELIRLVSEKMPDCYLRFGRLPSGLTDEAFQKEMVSLYADIVHETLFGKCHVGGALLRDGFMSLVRSSKYDKKLSPESSKLILKFSLSTVEVKGMRAFFSARQGITAAEFLRKATYSSDFPADLKKCFESVVSEFSSIETYRLYRFITDQKYVTDSNPHISFVPGKDTTKLPVASTCFHELRIPNYPNAQVMKSKLLMASHVTSLGES